jgi:hypothetical protein
LRIAEQVLRPGGTVAVHDYLSPYAKHDGVRQAVDAWRAGRPIRRVQTLAYMVP